jgi:ribose transport system ATP-binding protein
LAQNDKLLLQARGITKRFGHTTALKNVDIEVEAGKVVVLLGENGAGKSTLVKIISGVHQRDAGEIILNGQGVNFRTVRDAQHMGISIIHQELNLLPERTIAQNIFVGREPRINGLVVDYKKMVHNSKLLLDRIGLDLNPNMLVKKLSIAQQQMIEVTKALSFNLKLLIMDEPTSSLTSREIDKLFEIIKYLKQDNIGIIYISHRMNEIRIVGDQIMVMRDGERIDMLDAKTADINDVVHKMVGRKVEMLYRRNYNKPGETVLRTENLSGMRFRNLNINIRAGEIVSLAGLVGAGRTEVAKAIFGYDPIVGGRYFINGKEVKNPSPEKCVRLGMAFVPEDRKTEGLILSMQIRQNIVASSLSMLFHSGFINLNTEKSKAEQSKKNLRIACASVDQKASELSGGNQQKVVVAKWLVTESKFFIFDEPTRGIDVGAKAEIYQLMDTLAKQGAAILMISSEMNEVVNLSDRVYVMREGDMVKEFTGDKIDQKEIIAYTIGGGRSA